MWKLPSPDAEGQVPGEARSFAQRGGQHSGWTCGVIAGRAKKERRERPKRARPPPAQATPEVRRWCATHGVPRVLSPALRGRPCF